MHELACPPGKRNERRTNSRLTQLTAPGKTYLKREPPELGYYWFGINDVVHLVIRLCYMHASKHVCNEVL